MGDSPAGSTEIGVVGVEEERRTDGSPVAHDKAGHGQQPDCSQEKDCRWKDAKYAAHIEISKRNMAGGRVFLEQAGGDQITAESEKYMHSDAA